jgi:hypothetical protein
MEIRTKGFEGERLLERSSLAFWTGLKNTFKNIFNIKKNNFKNKDW